MHTKKITIIGSGALGTSLANVLKDANSKNEILIYGIDENELNDLSQGKNDKYFPGITFNSFKVSNDLKKSIKESNYLVLAIPSIAIEDTILEILENANDDTLIINGSKGFFPNTNKPIHEELVNRTQNNKKIRGVVSILGPSFASEIIKKSLTSIAAVGKDLNQLIEVQKLFKTNYFKLYCQTDVIGAEIGGIYKNILAIGAGMLNQLGYKINTLAVYLTRGMKELSIFNKFMGGEEKTIYGLTGLGDLILTATDTNSRNYTFGMNFVKGKKDTQNITLEGLTALKIVEDIRRKNNLSLPIQEALYNVIYKNNSIEEEIKKVWARELNKEE